MGEHGQSFARTDLSVGEAKLLAESVSQWLIETGVVVADEDPDALLAGVGHRPGSNWEAAVEPGNPTSDFLQLRSNGVKIEGGVLGVVLYPNGGALACSCPSCESDATNEFWGALQGWVDWTGENSQPTLKCASCETKVPLTDFQLDDSWSLSMLEVTFNNWGTLRTSFKEEMLARLDGNARFVWGKR